MSKATDAKRYRVKHRERINQKQREVYHANKDANRTARRLYSRSNQARMLPKQRQRRGLPEPTRSCPLLCEVCGSPPGKKALALDHDHETGKFRGWLCGRCNVAIGNAKDSSERLRALADYLEKNK